MKATTAWAETRKAAAELKERNDCTVTAVTIVTGKPYAEVHKAFTDAGRKPRKGVKRAITAKACKALGYELVTLDPTRYRARTGITVERDKAFKKGRYVIGMTRHLAACVDGTLHDWTSGSRKRVNDVFTLKPIEKAETLTAPPMEWRAVPTQKSLF